MSHQIQYIDKFRKMVGTGR